MALLHTAVCLFLIAVTTAVRPPTLQSEPTDVLRMFAAFPLMVAAYTSVNDTTLACSSATRTLFNPAERTVTYIWNFKAHSGHRGRDFVVDASFGGAPGQSEFFLNHDTTRSYTATYEYSDYATCLVMKFPFEGNQHCSLWVKEAVKYNVPKHCLDKYEKTCGHGFPLVDRNLCRD